MEAVYSWAAAVIFCAVAASLTEILTNGTKAEKTVRLVLGAFMLCAAVIPAASAAAPSDIEIPDITKLDTDNREITELGEKLLEERISELVQHTLEEKEILPQSVNTKAITDESGQITGLKAEVILERSQTDKSSLASEIIRSELGLECEVKISQTGGSSDG